MMNHAPNHCALRALLVVVLACACGPDNANTDASSTSSSSTSDVSLTSYVDGSTDATAPAPESSSEGSASTTSTEDDVCIAYCEVVEACQELGEPGCIDACDAFRRFRAENYDDACQAASMTRLTCIAMLTCEEYEAYECDPEGIAEYETCMAGTLPQPGVQSFCTLVASCGALPYDTCVVEILDYNIRESYELGCEVEYEALMACIGGLTCEEYEDEAMMEAMCAAEIAAVDAACPTFGQG
jgi:hypothetical protein